MVAEELLADPLLPLPPPTSPHFYYRARDERGMVGVGMGVKG